MKTSGHTVGREHPRHGPARRIAGVEHHELGPVLGSVEDSRVRRPINLGVGISPAPRYHSVRNLPYGGPRPEHAEARVPFWGIE